MKYNDTQYYYQGYSSHQTGLPYESSPHPIGNPARLEWCRGWRDAENDSRKRLTSTETDNANQQFESLASKPDEVWNGDGLPPVGGEVEAFIAVSSSCLRQWRRVVVALAGISGAEKECLVYDAETTAPSWADEFRPLRNQEELKREEACSAIKSIIVEFDIENVENRGDEMDIAKEIFFSIRAGKIPHIKLESDYE